MTTVASPSSVPRLKDWGELLAFPRRGDLPGAYPYTGGVYPYRREAEDRSHVAGEGPPERTNAASTCWRRASRRHACPPPSIPTTLYGEDPDTRPGYYGRTGNSGVSVATLDDMKKLYSGFDCALSRLGVDDDFTGPAPIILAMF